MGNDILMDVQHLSHIFRLNRKVEVHAVDDVSFQIKKGEIYMEQENSKFKKV